MVNDDKKAFGKRLKALLVFVGVDDREFGDALRLSTTQVANYFKGEQTPTFDGMAYLKNLFGIKYGELWGDEPFPKGMERSAVRRRIFDLINERNQS